MLERALSKKERREARARLGNRSLEDLVASEKELRLEVAGLKHVIQSRMVEASPIRVGYHYRIRTGRCAGRRILVSQLIVERGERWAEKGSWVVTIHGVLNNKQSISGDGWNTKHLVLWNSELDLESGEKGPRKYTQWQHRDDATDED